MAIYRMLQGATFDDSAVNAMTTAYEAALRELGLVNRPLHRDYRPQDH